MKPSAIGRILIWRGGSLWIGLAGEPTGIHAHHAVQIGLAFPGGTVKFRRPSGAWQSYGAALVPANDPHALDARGQQVAQLFIEPESREGRELQQRYGQSGIAALSDRNLGSPVAALARAYADHKDDATLIAGSRAVIDALVDISAAPEHPLDPRIARAVERIRANLGDTVTLAAVARAVHLSPDRFRHLFIEETGVALRPYVLWLRLERSLAAYIAGRTLTEAAYAGGFSDSAHLSRTFKRMFGISPASVHAE
jgi:AraC family transcriptional regulator